MKYRTTPAPRPAFTIVELLVAMALIVFIMYILAEAFAAGTTAFRNLKAIGDMNTRLRSVNTTLRRYLSADHFDGRRRLSDVDFWKNGPPQEGFLRIVQSGLSTSEGVDLDGLPSLGSNTQALHFSVKLRGNNRGDYFRASVPNSSNPSNVSPLLSLPFADSRFQDALVAPSPGGTSLICSPAAEVAIYLQATGSTEDVDFPNSVSQPLFTMFFRQRLLVPDNSLVTPAVSYNTPSNNWQNYSEVSATQDPSPTNNTNMYFNNMQDVTMPGRRWGKPGALPDTTSPGRINFIAANTFPILAQDNPPLAGSDVLLTDVLSCQISVLLDDNAYFLHTPANAPANTPVPKLPPNMQVPTAANTNNINFQSPDFIELSDDMMTPYIPSPTPPGPPAGQRIFDTWSNRSDDVYDYSNWQSAIPMFQYNQPNMPSHPLNGTKIRIRAIRITLRIWDSRTKQTRQSSIVVDM